jgi:hypothetical protein
MKYGGRLSLSWGYFRAIITPTPRFGSYLCYRLLHNLPDLLAEFTSKNHDSGLVIYGL